MDDHQVYESGHSVSLRNFWHTSEVMWLWNLKMLQFLLLWVFSPHCIRVRFNFRFRSRTQLTVPQPYAACLVCLGSGGWSHPTSLMFLATGGRWSPCKTACTMGSSIPVAGSFSARVRLSVPLVEALHKCSELRVLSIRSWSFESHRNWLFAFKAPELREDAAPVSTAKQSASQGGSF